MFVSKIVDPFGFSWFVKPTNLKFIYPIHLIYLIDFPRAVEASDWYQAVFACVTIDI
jgi:hypothetical protein